MYAAVITVAQKKAIPEKKKIYIFQFTYGGQEVKRSARNRLGDIRTEIRMQRKKKSSIYLLPYTTTEIAVFLFCFVFYLLIWKGAYVDNYYV